MAIYRLRATTSVDSEGYAYLATKTEERPHLARPGLFFPRPTSEWVAYVAGQPELSEVGLSEAAAIGKLVIAIGRG